MTDNDVFKGYGIRVTLADEDSFLLIKETLTRIGISSKKDKILYPSCYLLHKRGEYAIMHFKELFSLDGKYSDISENDIARRNTIALLLEDWDLLDIIDKNSIETNTVEMNQIKILSYKDKEQYEIHHKYSIGSKK
jgi:Bacteriophage translational regulator